MQTKFSESDTFLKPIDLVRRWRNAISLGTLANWRSNKSGPNFTKLGGRILYRLSDVVAWETKNNVAPDRKRATVNKASR